MNVRIILMGALLVIAPTLTSCLSHEEWARAQVGHQESPRAQAGRQALDEVFSEGLTKLQKGMSAAQVTALLGRFPINPATIDSAIAAGERTTVRFGGHTFVFDAKGLESW